MPTTQQQLATARSEQHAAAHDASAQVRLIAGPGSGKSFAIEERVSWLLQSGVDGDGIFAISFTNASADDLRERIAKSCAANGQDANSVSITTMHALALRLLRRANLLTRFPAAPLVLDQWELDKIFGEEFGAVQNVGKRRTHDIRRNHEAFWSTGSFAPPNYIPPVPPITDAERDALTAFLSRFEQLYSCILPGEIVRECVDNIRAGLIEPAQLVGIEQLIVDEYQDLNPIDLEFVDAIVADGASAFVSGDDDQSIYSFRFAFPQGIQQFLSKYPGSGDHGLSQCFRCTVDVLTTALTIIGAHPPQNRIQETHRVGVCSFGASCSGKCRQMDI